jgi:hypothetical protein
MPIHKIIQEKRDSEGEWTMTWIDSEFSLQDPNGRVVIADKVDQIHQQVDFRRLAVDHQIVFVKLPDLLEFQLNYVAASDLLTIVKEGLTSDPAYLPRAVKGAENKIKFGIIMFLISGGLFGSYCWMAMAVPDEHVPQWVLAGARVIKFTLIFLLAGTLAGPMISYYGLQERKLLCRLPNETPTASLFDRPGKIFDRLDKT